MYLTMRNVQTILLSLVCVSLILVLSFCVSAQVPDSENKNATPTTGALSGRVITETGQPVSHATVYVTSPASPGPPRITFTDDGGNFEVSGLDSLIYNVGAAAPAYVTTPRDPDTLPNYYRIGDTVTVRLLRGGVITGTVTLATGEPMTQNIVRAILIRDSNGKPLTGPRFPSERLTDDRGVYRIYGLASGTYLVSAGGRANSGYFTNAYDSDSPTFSPSSTRDTAAEIVVRTGEETTAVDIRYRGEPGHAVSGVVSGPMMPNAGPNITLTQIVNGATQSSAFAFQASNTQGFAFYGVADGTYELNANSSLGIGESATSEPLRITVKGADVSGISLVVKGLGSITGHVVLETSVAAECKNKRQPLLSETLLVAQRSEKINSKDQPALPSVFAQASPDKAGDFVLRNLLPGQRNFTVRFFAKYWYLRSIARDIPVLPPPRSGPANRQLDVARTGLQLKFGERVSGLTVRLAEGAASLRGAVKLADGASVPAKLYLNLVPAEKESAEDVLRFFSVTVNSDGGFVVNNVPPGRYWALAGVASESEPRSDVRLRAPEEAAMRAEIRRAAEEAKTAVELKPCENVSDYSLPFKPKSQKN